MSVQATTQLAEALGIILAAITLLLFALKHTRAHSH